MFYFRGHIKKIIFERNVKNIVTNILNSFHKDEHQVKYDTTTNKFTFQPDTASSVSAIESTLIQNVSEENKNVKPIVQKYKMIQNIDTLDYLVLIANKAFKTMYLLQNQNVSWNVIKEYDIAIGEQGGKKIFAGDRRTPEGQYFIVGRKEYSELSSIYGPLAYVLNYPNEEDRKSGRTGQGIWIHGTAPDSVPIETRGCLEMKNEELKDLSAILMGGIGIPVLIVNDDQLKDPVDAFDFKVCDEKRRKIMDNYHKTKLHFKEFLTKWKIAWETKNIIEYETYYDTLQFMSQGLDWNGWKERKLRTFDLYDTIAITIDNILITDYSEQTTIVKFYQVYKTNLNQNENAKKLSLEKVNDFWKIISESTCLKEELLL
jgi:hypothetical protein